LTLLFLIALGLAWIAVFLPAAIRAREMSPLTATERFRRRMQLLAPTRPVNGRTILVPESPERLRAGAHRRDQRRRKRILESLTASVVASFVAALVVGHGMWQVHLALDASLGSYVVLLLAAKRKREEKRTKVRPLGFARPQEPLELGTARASGEQR
jgi:Flp pilus assembly protein TadB